MKTARIVNNGERRMFRLVHKREGQSSLCMLAVDAAFIPLGAPRYCVCHEAGSYLCLRSIPHTIPVLIVIMYTPALVNFLSFLACYSVVTLGSTPCAG